MNDYVDYRIDDSNLKSVPWFSREQLKLKKQYKKEINLLKSSKEKILLISEFQHYNELIDDKVYCKFTDPYIDYFPERFEKLDVITPQSKVFNRDFYNKPYRICAIPYVSYFWNSHKKDLTNKIKIELLKLDLDQINVDVLSKSVYQTLLYANYFIEVLKKINPKFVALPCYYSEFNYGIILACKKLDIPVSDIQHGSQGGGHAVYRNFKFDKRVDLVPNEFWVWGDYFKKDLEMRLNNKRKVRVVGNFWVEKTKNDTLNQELIRRINEYENVVLCATQVDIEEDFQFNYIKEISQMNSDILFLIRLHPRMKMNLSYLDSFYSEIKNIEIQLATESKLHAILQKIDSVLTMWSSVAVESLVYNKPVVFNHVKGEKGFPEIFKIGMGVLAVDSKQFRYKFFDIKNTSENDTVEIIKNDFQEIKKELNNIIIE